MTRRILPMLLAVLMLFSLCGCSSSSGAAQTQLPAEFTVPYADGDYFVFSHTDDLSPAGTLTHYTEKTESGWHLYSEYADDQGTLTCGAEVEDGSLRPTRAYKFSVVPEAEESWEMEGIYSADKLNVQADSSYGVETSESNLPESNFFDNESIIMAMRCFPMEEGFSATFRLASIQSGEIAPMQVKVEGQEEVNGKTCWRVALLPSMMFAKASITVWYTADEAHVPMKMEQGTSVFELIEHGNTADPA